MTRVVIARSALRTLRRMDKATAKRISDVLDKLEDDPDRTDLDIRRLKARDGFRIRVGQWRIIFEREADVITILTIGPRGQVYR
jgi:mRNA interferase RelE/StbE